MIKKIYDLPVLNFVFRTAGTVPIVPRSEDEAAYEQAFEDIDGLLAAGELVCIFPEGSLSQDGELQDFRPGIEKILARRPVPVVPMALRGLWGSFFSAKGGLFKNPSRFWSRVDVAAATPVPAGVANVEMLQDRVRALLGDTR